MHDVLGVCTAKDGQAFSGLLNGGSSICKNLTQVDTFLAAALMTTWACADTAALELQDLDCMHMEGFVHTSMDCVNLCCRIITLCQNEQGPLKLS